VAQSSDQLRFLYDFVRFENLVQQLDKAGRYVLIEALFCNTDKRNVIDTIDSYDNGNVENVSIRMSSLLNKYRETNDTNTNAI